MPFDCAISVRSLQTIFWKNSPVHDGAVIIRRGRVAAAGVILPLTQNFEYRHLSGTRHRAGIGISEETDALVVLVSEETGKISVADHGKLHENLSRSELDAYLRREFGVQAARRLTAMKLITVNWECNSLPWRWQWFCIFIRMINASKTRWLSVKYKYKISICQMGLRLPPQYEPDVDSVRVSYRGLG